jgi:hypothetical protein
MKVLKIDKTVTVITDDGQVITNSNCSEELFKEVYTYVQADNIEEVKRLLVPELCAEEKKFVAKKRAVETIHSMAEHQAHLFTVTGTALYRNGINLSIPEDLALAYVEAYQNWFDHAHPNAPLFEETDEFEALDRFWMWCSLNPNAESREDLFRFLQHHNMQITSQGMFLAYRRVVSRGGNSKEFVNFISNSYIKVKAKWKKNPADYFVYEKDGELTLIHQNSIQDTLESDESTYVIKGSLEALYLDLPNLSGDQFTDAHTHTMDYRIGVEARIERHQGNQSNQVSCSKGLHVASKAYNYSGFGDTAIIVAVNPMDVLAVPRGEDGKLRTCAFTPVAVLEVDEENNILEGDDSDFTDILFTHYEEQVENLRNMIEGSTAYELNVNHILNAPSQFMLDTIISNLESAQEIINNRTSYLS